MASIQWYAYILASVVLAIVGFLQMFVTLESLYSVFLWAAVAMLGVLLLVSGVVVQSDLDLGLNEAADPDDALEKTDSRFGR